MHVLLPVVIAAANVPQQISATSIKCNRVIIQAQRGNAAALYIGDSNVSSSSAEGFEMNIPQANVFLFPLILESAGQNDIDLSLLYIAGAKDDGVNVLYYQL